MRELAFVGLSDDGTCAGAEQHRRHALRRPLRRAARGRRAPRPQPARAARDRPRRHHAPRHPAAGAARPEPRRHRGDLGPHRRAGAALRRAGARRARAHGRAGAPSRAARRRHRAHARGDGASTRSALGGVDPELLEWDAWRREDGRWSLLASWEPVDPSAPRRHGGAVDLRPRRPHHRRRRPRERVAARRAGPSRGSRPTTDRARSSSGCRRRRVRQLGRRLRRPRRRVHRDRRARLRRGGRRPRRPAAGRARRRLAARRPLRHAPRARPARGQAPSRRARRKAARETPAPVGDAEKGGKPRATVPSWDEILFGTRNPEG